LLLAVGFGGGTRAVNKQSARRVVVKKVKSKRVTNRGCLLPRHQALPKHKAPRPLLCSFERSMQGQSCPLLVSLLPGLLFGSSLIWALLNLSTAGRISMANAWSAVGRSRRDQGVHCDLLAVKLSRCCTAKRAIVAVFPYSVCTKFRAARWRVSNWGLPQSHSRAS
jgi:hypothetical protein